MDQERNDKTPLTTTLSYDPKFTVPHSLSNGDGVWESEEKDLVQNEHLDLAALCFFPLFFYGL